MFSTGTFLVTGVSLAIAGVLSSCQSTRGVSALQNDADPAAETDPLKFSCSVGDPVSFVIGGYGVDKDISRLTPPLDSNSTRFSVAGEDSDIVRIDACVVDGPQPEATLQQIIHQQRSFLQPVVYRFDPNSQESVPQLGLIGMTTVITVPAPPRHDFWPCSSALWRRRRA